MVERTGELLAVVSVGLGVLIGYAAGRVEMFIRTRRHESIIRDLLNRIQAPDPWSYEKLSQVSGGGGGDVGEKPADPALGEVNVEPWRTDPEYEGVDVVVDEGDGVVYITTDEDTYEEDIRIFLGRYGLSVDDLPKPDAAL